MKDISGEAVVVEKVRKIIKEEKLARLCDQLYKG